MGLSFEPRIYPCTAAHAFQRLQATCVKFDIRPLMVTGGRKRHDIFAFECCKSTKIIRFPLQSNPPNGSPDNGSIRLLDQALAGPILELT